MPDSTLRAAGHPGGSIRSGVALIGLAHGSRHPGVVPAIERLLAAVAASEGIEARAAFLDLSEPDLATVATELGAAGHATAVVVPLLFTAAFHANVDVPEAIAAASTSSGLDLLCGDIIGTGTDVEALLRASLVEVSPRAPVLLYAVGSSDPTANAAVDDLADRLARSSGADVRVGFATSEPRAAAVLAEFPPGSAPVTILPLFLAPGLLLDPMVSRAAEHDWFVVEPLAERAASILAERYHAGVTTITDTGRRSGVR